MTWNIPASVRMAWSTGFGEVPRWKLMEIVKGRDVVQEVAVYQAHHSHNKGVMFNIQ